MATGPVHIEGTLRRLAGSVYAPSPNLTVRHWVTSEGQNKVRSKLVGHEAREARSILFLWLFEAGGRRGVHH